MPRIAFVVDWLKDSYQQEVLDGAARAATAHGAQLIALPGGVLMADHEHGRLRNRLFEVIRSKHFDALVIMTGTLGNTGGVESLRSVLGDLDPAHICHIAVEVPDQASVLIDNRHGVRRMVEHLIRVHGARHVAFIRGPEANAEAQMRFAAYREALEAQSIEYNERLVLPGDFRKQAGVAAISELLDERGFSAGDLDAVVAADDLMALAAMEELRRRGIRVPVDVAVVGFDDIEESAFASPPLSTVRQPLAKQGRVAVETVLQALEGQTRGGPRVLDTICQYRRSCGCTSEDPGGLTMRPPSETRTSLRESIEKRRRLLAAEMLGAAEGGLSELKSDWAGPLVDALVETVDGREEAFRETLDVLLERLVEARIDASVGNLIVSALRRQLSVCAGDNPAQIRQVESLLHDARILVSQAVGRSQAQRRLQMETESVLLSEITSALALAAADELTTTLARELPRIGIRDFMLLSLHGDSVHTELLLSSGERAPSSMRVALQDLSPAQLLQNPQGANLLVQPLDDGSRCVGLAVFLLDEVRMYQSEVLRDLLGRAVVKLLPAH